MNFIITSPHHPFVNYAFGYQSIACSPQTKLQNHRLGFFMYALGNQSFFLNKCHLYIHWICGGGGGAQNVFSCLQINSSFIEMHLVPASNNNYSTLTESILTLMIFFSFLFPYGTCSKRWPYISENYQPNNALFCSPFHQGYTDEHQIPLCSCYAWQSLSQLHFAEYRTS